MRHPLRTTQQPQMALPDPPFLRALLSDVRFAWPWLIVRVGLGWLWLEVGWHRVQAPPAVAGDVTTWVDRGAAIGQTLAGIALILGSLTGLAAFLGGCLGGGLVTHGDVVTTALVLSAVIWLALAWKTAGWIGLDRWLLPMLGMPWRGSVLFAPPPALASHDESAKRGARITTGRQEQGHGNGDAVTNAQR